MKQFIYKMSSFCWYSHTSGLWIKIGEFSPRKELKRGFLGWKRIGTWYNLETMKLSPFLEVHRQISQYQIDNRYFAKPLLGMRLNLSLNGKTDPILIQGVCRYSASYDFLDQGQWLRRTLKCLVDEVWEQSKFLKL